MISLKILLIYLITVNLVAFIMYGVDKSKAIKGKWRISEYSLIAAAVIGGSVGAIAGMKVFHHKTKKIKFYFGLPAILVFQIVFIIVCIGLVYSTGGF